MSAEYEITCLIGEGSFGKVYKAKSKVTGDIVAYKIISKVGKSSDELITLRRECEIQKHLVHPNIVRMLDTFETDSEIVVVTEFAQKALHELLAEHRVFQEPLAQKIICDLVSALYYLHSHRILHRDLKPQNVLLDKCGTIKLCDFGFATCVGSTNVVTSIKGTPLYMAPELIGENPYDHNADLWSLGCISYELVVGHPPFTTSSIMQLVQMVRSDPIMLPGHLSPEFLSFLHGLLQKHPQSRLSWPHLLYHPFVYGRISVVNEQMAAPSTHLPEKVGRTNEITNISPTNKSKIKHDNNQYQNKKKESTDTSDTDGFRSEDSDSCNEDEIEESENDELIDMEIEKEEWMEFIRSTSKDVMEGDIESLSEKTFLKMVTRPLKNGNCGITVMIMKLLSLPFVVETITEAESEEIKNIYFECNVLPDVLRVTKTITLNSTIWTDDQLNCMHHVSLLLCHLIITKPDNNKFLIQFYDTSLKEDMCDTFKLIFINSNHRTNQSLFINLLFIFTRIITSDIYHGENVSTFFQRIFKCKDTTVVKFHELLHWNDDVDDQMLPIVVCTFISTLATKQRDLLQTILNDNGTDTTEMIRTCTHRIIKRSESMQMTKVAQLALQHLESY